MGMQWVMTGGIVVACLVYAIRTLVPKLAPVQSVGGGCGGCSGCDLAAKPCTAVRADFQAVEFHPGAGKKN